jgi:hypothetical protein
MAIKQLVEFFTMLKKTVAPAAIFFSLSLLSSVSHAVLINFDDLVREPGDSEFPCFCDHPLTNEYEAQGLIIDGGFLAEYDENSAVQSGPNYLLGSNFLTLRFVGTLPTFVSMYVSAASMEKIFLNAWGTDGLIGQQQTEGDSSPDEGTPYVPNQFISFTSATGIASITLEGFYNLRVSSMVDDLTYEYASVPEPTPLMLLALGLLGLGCRKFAKRRVLEA